MRKYPRQSWGSRFSFYGQRERLPPLFCVERPVLNSSRPGRVTSNYVFFSLTLKRPPSFTPFCRTHIPTLQPSLSLTFVLSRESVDFGPDADHLLWTSTTTLTFFPRVTSIHIPGVHQYNRGEGVSVYKYVYTHVHVCAHMCVCVCVC